MSRVLFAAFAATAVAIAPTAVLAAAAKPAAKPVAAKPVAKPTKTASAKSATGNADVVVAPTPGSTFIPTPVYCGSFTPFYFRVAALGKNPEARSLHAMDIINKYLGGKVGKVTTKPDGKHIRVLLNNDMLAIVTPEDAAAEKMKTPALLAAKWTKQLSVAFDQSKAQP